MAAEILVILIAAAPDDVKAVMMLRLPAWRISGRQSAGAVYNSV